MRSTLLVHAVVLAATLGGAASVAAFQAAPAQQDLGEILTPSGEWTLRVDDDVATLRLADGSVSRTARGDLEMKFEVTWAGAVGTLSAIDHAATSTRAIAVELGSRSGDLLRCNGFLSGTGEDLMMAGVCRGRGSASAWHAVRLVKADSPGSPPGVARGRRMPQLHPCATSPTVSVVTTQPGATADKSSGSGGGFQPAPVGSYVGQLTGRHEDQKRDNTQRDEFPDAPQRNSKLQTWVAAHNKALLNVISVLYPQRSDRDLLLSVERDTCTEGGDFCRMTFRQQAILNALSGGR